MDMELFRQPAVYLAKASLHSQEPRENAVADGDLTEDLQERRP